MRRELGVVAILVGLFLIWRVVATGASTQSVPPTQSSIAASSGAGSGQAHASDSGAPSAPLQGGATGSTQSTVTLGDGQYGATGTGVTQGFDVQLDAGQAVVGQSYGFNGQKTGCRVWLIAGPYRGHVTISDGEYFKFISQSLSARQENALLAAAARKQASQSYSCSSSNQRVTRLGGAA